MGKTTKPLSSKIAPVFILAIFVCVTVFLLFPSGGRGGEGGNERVNKKVVAQIASGGKHTCALTQTGRVKCWGANDYGQLGDGTTADKATPIDVSGLYSGISAISAGYYHTCALTQTGRIKCWGDNSYGQLGDGTTTQKTTPVEVSGLTSSVSAISAGGFHTCALTQTGGVKCWGANEYGQLGDGTTTPKTTPVDVSGLTSGVIAISAGYYHTCALAQTGGVKCWGANKYGQLGDGTFGDDNIKNTPVDVSKLTSGVNAIAAGYHHTCALTQSGKLKCWGNNGNGQLGNGDTSSRNIPVDASELTSVVSAISGGEYHTCALTKIGEVKCWGANWSGQLGDGSTTDRTAPVNVSGLPSGVKAISSGGEHSCAITQAGKVKCWGANWSGQIGDGSSDNTRPTPVDVLNLTLW